MHQRRHERLIDDEQFERVQRVLATHAGTGTRQRSHPHYLKGLVWCARCTQRFTLQRAKGRHGGIYYYGEAASSDSLGYALAGTVTAAAVAVGVAATPSTRALPVRVS